MTLRSAAASALPSTREQTLLERAREMDAAAWEEIFATNHGAIYRYLYRRLGDQSAAEDLAAEVFLEAVKGIDRFRYRGTALRAWLYRIAHNLAVDHVRREVRRNGASGDQREDETVAGFADQVADRAEVESALRQLTGEQQQVIILRFYEGLSVEEVGEVLRKRAGAVKALQHRALRRMRALLARTEDRA